MHNPAHTNLIEDIQDKLEELKGYKKRLRNCDAKLLEESLEPVRRRLEHIFSVIKQVEEYGHRGIT